MSLSYVDEKLVYLCRLMRFVDGDRLHSEERKATTILLSEHTFRAEIERGMKCKPIFFRDCSGFEPDLCFLSLAMCAYEPESEYGSCWVMGIFKEMYEYVLLAKKLQLEIEKTVFEIAKSLRIEENVRKIHVEEYEMLLRRPAIARKPCHLHFTTHTAGGGDPRENFARFCLEMKRNEPDSEDIDNTYESPDPLYHPVGWYTDSNGSDLSIDQRKFQKMFVGNPSQVETKCAFALKTARTLQALADEVEDVHSQFVMWRALPCAMAAHSRLGMGSPLACLGPDLIQNIAAFALEF
jgi:hypothetical protein